MRVIGTAGHVDHGKSTLVERLSGINPDRLAEEQSRKMTIDLGFAWLDLPNGETIGIIDVPGHRDFIENMLAGVGGIDAALLVIAADEGIMPQTREHLSILRLLDIRKVIVVLSKIDLIDDPEWVELVELEIEDLLGANDLEGVPILSVSAQTGVGIQDLLARLEDTLGQLPQRVNFQQPRLPVDRVFVVSGFGMVVTGTLTGGLLSVGNTIELQPSGKRGRIRGLQSYKREVETAGPGSRVAVNIAGINSGDAVRGDVLTVPGLIQATLLADAYFSHLEDLDRPLSHNAEVKVFAGAAEAIANVRLLETDKLAPGSQGWMQIRLREALPLARGDRFILRYPSPAQTIGGGLIVNPHPGRRLKRFQPDVINDLELRLRGTPGERLAQSAGGGFPVALDELQKRLGCSDEDLSSALEEALREGLVRQFSDRMVIATASWEKLAHTLALALGEYHRDNPLRLGLLRAELRSRLKLKASLLERIIVEDERFIAEANLIRLFTHAIAYSDGQHKQIGQLMTALEDAAFTPPTIAEMNQVAGEEVVRSLLDQRRLVQVSDNIAFSAQAYDALVAEVRRYLGENDEIDAKSLRDKFGTSRKYAIPVLEHLDSLGITQRVGDVRRRGRNL